MLPFDLSALPLAVVAAMFAAAAAVVWFAGTRLSGYVEAISERTGLGAVFLGALLLGGITSLPELATSVSASMAGDADLAVNNLFGGVAMQVAILAAADGTLRRRSLSSATHSPGVLLQGVLLVLLLGIAVAGMTIGEPDGWPVGAWTAAILIATLGAFRLMRAAEGHARWRPVTDEGRLEEARPAPQRRDQRGSGAHADDDRPTLAALIGLSCLAALAILAAGVVLARAGESLAHRTALGSGFVGVAFLALATSLPEVSTTIAAARLGRYDMAFSNIFGANLLDVGLLGVVDIAYAGPPVFNEVGPSALLGAVLGVVVTAIFLAGILLRRVRRVARVGVDSLLVTAVYLAGLFALYRMR